MASKKPTKLINKEVTEYLEILKSDAPAPGGGTVSALAGAQGVALLIMVCGLTIGRERYAAYQDICVKVKDRAEGLYMELLELIDEDAEAYMVVSNAYKLPKGTDEEKADRSQAIADATRMATAVPYRTMELCYEGMMLSEELFEHSNPNAASDLGVAVLNLMAGAQGAWLNVKINLPGVKDRGMAKAFTEDGQKMYDQSEMIAIKLYDGILRIMES